MRTVEQIGKDLEKIEEQLLPLEARKQALFEELEAIKNDIGKVEDLYASYE